MLLESLESRALLTTYTYPYGASPDDTGEYMLGDVVVNVVFMQSDPGMAPYDVAPSPQGHGFTQEVWTPDEIAGEEAKISAGLQWWKDTLANMFPSAPSNLLNFDINWKYADTPVHTGYEPIARISNDFAGNSLGGGGKGWIYDFLHFAGYDATGNFSSDIKAFNDSTRQAANADWATTIFVVNNFSDFDAVAVGSVATAASATQFTAPAGSGLSTIDGYYDGQSVKFTTGALAGQRALIDNYVAATKTFTLDPGLSAKPGVNDQFQIGDGQFAAGGSFSQAFSFAGGRFEVVPATRPIKTFAHETGHQFWALDEYAGSSPSTAQRGYYDTENLNAVDGQPAGFVQADSIMSNGLHMENSYENHTVDPYTAATIGWQDSDHNGIFDVLDVPFSLSGYGQYNSSTGKYEFRGSTHVNALPNVNSYYNSGGTDDDIQIDQISTVEVSLDDGLTWHAVASYPARTYSTDVSVDIGNLAPGINDIWLRSRDTRTGVTSNIFKGESDVPTQDDGVGMGGLVFLDSNSNGKLDTGEPLEPDVAIQVDDQSDTPLNTKHLVEPDDFDAGASIIPADPNVSLVIDGAGATGTIVAVNSTIAPSAGNVFGISGSPQQQTWGSNGFSFEVDFASPVSTVSINAYGASSVSSSYARLDAYDSNGDVIARYSSGALNSSGFTTMSVGRTQGDIAYVIAYARSGSIVLDTLQWGPSASATSNSDGVYALDYLPDGTYHVHVSPPAGYTITTPAGGYATISVANGRTTNSVNFGIAPPSSPTYPFHNSANPYLVDFHPGVDPPRAPAPIDAVAVISYLNAHAGQMSFPSSADPNVVGYVDVIANGMCSPEDAVAVISYLNAHFGASPEGELTSSPPPSGGGSQGSAEGEAIRQVEVAQNAAQYFSQNPNPFLTITDVDGDASPVSSNTAGSADITASGASPPVPSATNSVFASQWLTGLMDASDKIRSLGVSLPSLLTSNVNAALPPSLPSSVRKHVGDSLDRISGKLEKTLDDIADDVAQAEAKIGADAGDTA